MMKSRQFTGARLFAAAATVGLMAFAAAPASAGTCPADKVGVDVQKPGATAPKGVSDNVLAMTDLGKEAIGADGFTFRLRRMEIEPGGEVPWHSHAERPAMIYIIQGEVLEYSSTCAVPIVHKAGDVAPESHPTSHWWKNQGKEKVVLISVDIIKDPKDKTM